MKVTVYSKPHCPYCVLAKDWLAQHGIDHQIVDVSKDHESLAFIKGKGHTTIPQLYVGENILVEGGFNGLKTMGIDQLKTKLAEMSQ